MRWKLSCALIAAGLMASPVSGALSVPQSISGEPQASPVHEPGPAAVARRCVHAIGHTTRATGASILGATRTGVKVIVRLERNGAPDEAIQRAAGAAAETIQSRAARGASAVNEIADRCVAALSDADAPDELIHAVERARRAGLATIRGAAEDALRRIRQAAHRALSN